MSVSCHRLLRRELDVRLGALLAVEQQGDDQPLVGRVVDLQLVGDLRPAFEEGRAARPDTVERGFDSRRT